MKLTDVTQGALEVYETHLLDERNDQLSAAKFNRIIIEAAVDAGFAKDVPKDLKALAPYEVRQMTTDIAAHVAAAKAPPDPN